MNSFHRIRISGFGSFSTNEKLFLTLLVCALISFFSFGQTQNNMQQQNDKNPLLCEPEDGACEIPNSNSESVSTKKPSTTKKPIKVIYKMKGQYKYSISCINDHGTLLKTQHEEAYTLQVARRLCTQVPSDFKNLSTHLITQ